MLGLLHAAKLDDGLPPRFFRRRAGAQVVLDVQLQMAFDRIGNFAFATRRPYFSATDPGLEGRANSQT